VYALLKLFGFLSPKLFLFIFPFLFFPFSSFFLRMLSDAFTPGFQ